MQAAVITAFLLDNGWDINATGTKEHKKCSASNIRQGKIETWDARYTSHMMKTMFIFCIENNLTKLEINIFT